VFMWDQFFCIFLLIIFLQILYLCHYIDSVNILSFVLARGSLAMHDSAVQRVTIENSWTTKVCSFISSCTNINMTLLGDPYIGLQHDGICTKDSRMVPPEDIVGCCFI
jgi:hypothetical protein